MITSVALCLSTILTGCNRSNGSGRYLINVIGSSPGSDAVYIYDSARRSISRLCGDGAHDSSRCFMAATDGQMSVVTASVLPVGDVSDPSELNLRITSKGHRAVQIKNPTTGKCDVLDVSVSPDGAIVLTTLYSHERHASSIWRLSTENLSWKQLTEWELTPSWVARPQTVAGTNDILYLKFTRGPNGLTSQLQKFSLSTGVSQNLFPDRQIASFASGKSGQIALWTQFGLETFDQSSHSSLVVLPNFLTKTDSIQPGSLAWNLNHNKIALLLVDRETNVAKLYEFDPILKDNSLVLKKKLGPQVSIQQLY